MNKQEFLIAQDRLGCTNMKLAEWMGVQAETVSRWRNGSKAIPKYAERLLSALETGWRP